ncbi:hypothetical protein HDU76_011361, partial [Blyttiomyces sp. JEL0837]
MMFTRLARRVPTTTTTRTTSNLLQLSSRTKTTTTTPNRTPRRTLASVTPESSSPSDDPSLPQFVVGTRNGFLPRQDPLARLPDRFGELESLLERMPLILEDGTPGLLAKGEFGDAVKKELPVYNVADIKDSRTLT